MIKVIMMLIKTREFLDMISLIVDTESIRISRAKIYNDPRRKVVKNGP